MSSLALIAIILLLVLVVREVLRHRRTARFAPKFTPENKAAPPANHDGTKYALNESIAIKRDQVIKDVFAKHKIPQQIDAIVIGSGIGGLTCASLLSKYANAKVLVLEQHDQAGGCLHTFEEKGFEWDTGVHYIGQMDQDESLLRTLLDDICTGSPTGTGPAWQRMDEVYDEVIIAGEHYPFKSGKSELIAMMKSKFPGEEKAIDKYFKFLSESKKSVLKFFAAKILFRDYWLDNLLAKFFMKDFFKYSEQTVDQVLKSTGASEKLRGVMTHPLGDYGLPPKKASAIIHSLVANHYLWGAAYPVGGTCEITHHIIPTITQNGGKVLVQCRVKKINVDMQTRKVTGVTVQRANQSQSDSDNDIFIPCKTVISGAGLLNTIHRLLPREISAPLQSKLTQTDIEKSISHIYLFVGLNGSTEELELPSKNIWVFPSYDHDENTRRYYNMKTEEIVQALDDPTQTIPFSGMFLSFPSAKDSTWQKRYPNKSVAIVIAEGNFEWFKEYESERVKQRSKYYKDMKEAFGARLMEELHKHCPKTKGRVEMYDIGSPLTNNYYINSVEGESYGLDQKPSRFNSLWLKPDVSDVCGCDGLYMSGQDVATVGMTGAMLGGLLTASVLMNADLFTLMTKKAQQRKKQE